MRDTSVLEELVENIAGGTGLAPVTQARVNSEKFPEVDAIAKKLGSDLELAGIMANVRVASVEFGGPVPFIHVSMPSMYPAQTIKATAIIDDAIGNIVTSDWRETVQNVVVEQHGERPWGHSEKHGRSLVTAMKRELKLD